jgi:YbgC/YbaW family acyl-CoA thioester hydrolase
MTSEYRLKRSVHFYETDAAGIVHFSCFPRYMEEAEHALWKAAGLSTSRPVSAIGWPRVAMSFEFYRPLRFDDEFEIRIWITAIEEKRLHYACLLRRGDTQLASGTMTIACTNRAPDGRMKSMPIPKDIAARFEVAESPG